MFKGILFFVSISSMSLCMWDPSPDAIREQALKKGDNAARFTGFGNNEMPADQQNNNLISSISNNKIPCAILIFVCYVFYELKIKKQAKEKEDTQTQDDKPFTSLKPRKAII